MVDITCVVGLNSIRCLCKAYKSIIKKWFRRKKLSSSSEDNPQCAPQKPVEDEKSGTTMNGIRSSRLNDDALRGNDRKSSRGSLHRRRSFDDLCFPSLASLSRKASRKINHNPSKSCENFDFMNTPSSWYSMSGSIRMHPHLHSRNASRGNSTTIMYSNSSGMLKPPAIEKYLECTLEELCYGCKKKIKITRDVFTDTGEIVEEEELLTINVEPGWKKGTMITFEGKGNERLCGYREDVVFFISEKTHQLFRREGDDLELGVEIPLLEALTGGTIPIPLLGGEEMSLIVDDIIYPGYEKIITDQGMPISREPGKRGNLIITFLVEFPTQLTNNQRSEVVAILQDSC